MLLCISIDHISLTSISLHTSRPIRQPASSWNLARLYPVWRSGRPRWLWHGTPECGWLRWLAERGRLHGSGSSGPGAFRPWLRRLPGLGTLRHRSRLRREGQKPHCRRSISTSIARSWKVSGSRRPWRPCDLPIREGIASSLFSFCNNFLFPCLCE